jgi:ribose-phosphate pyrophosphokinase
MELTLLAGRSNAALAKATAAELGTRLCNARLETFPDGELHVEIEESLRGHDVFVLQATSPPAETHLMELLLMADACRRAGASRLTAVTPYFGYARQDRRASGREAVGARVVTDLLEAVRFDRAVAVDLHSGALEGFFSTPLEHVSAVPTLVDAIRPLVDARAVIVAPDLGATKLAERYAMALQLPVAMLHKVRVSGEEVHVRRITGDVFDRSPIVVDDMISTGGTIAAAVTALREASSRKEISVAATHGLLVGSAVERLRQLELRALVVTDSVERARILEDEPETMPELRVVCLGPLLADAIWSLYRGQSLNSLIVHR